MSQKSQNTSAEIELMHTFTELNNRKVMLLLDSLITLYQSGTRFDLFPFQPYSLDIDGKLPVFVCWWQGEENAPELVRLCLNSLRKNLPKDRIKLFVIDFDNLDQYIRFPDWVMEKYERGAITMTHLSDILRASLLNYYGGMWLDATYYLAKPLPSDWFSDKTFYTPRFMDERLRDTVFSPAICQNGESLWSGNFFLTDPGNLLFSFLMNGLYAYWAQKDNLIDYFLIDQIIRIGYEKIPEIRKEIDAIPHSQPNLCALEQKLPERFDPASYEMLLRDTDFFKLSYYAVELRREDTEGFETYYGHLWKEQGL